MQMPGSPSKQNIQGVQESAFYVILLSAGI
jgi:hypothetical protein